MLLLSLMTGKKNILNNNNNNNNNNKNHYFIGCRSMVVIAQSSPIGFQITNVTAVDGDLQGTRNTEISFSLVDTTLPFAIDPVSGLLSTRQDSPDLMGQVYNIQVVATDMGSPQLSSTGTIIVDVAPPNLFAPVFTFVTPATITENTTPQGVLYSFDVTDLDIGSEGEMRVVLLPGPYSSNFSLTDSPITNGIQVGITYNGPGFDREQINNFTLTFRAEDQGNELFRRQTQDSVTFSVLDVNDNSPTLVGAPYSAMVSEGADVGDLVTTVVARDPDLTGTVTFSTSLSGGDFSIDPNSGAVTVNAMLRVSTRDFYRFPITVSDGVNSIESYINITVTEVNDQIPMFEPVLPGSITIPETTPSGTTLLNFTVTDEDTGISGEISVSLLQTDDLFELGTYSTNEHYISTTRAIDFEVSYK